MSFRKFLISSVLAAGILTANVTLIYAQNITYTVQSGDTFFKISQKYDIPLDTLMKANNATQNTILYTGQNIVIPLGDQTVHTVQAGETYWIISQKYNVNLNELMLLNGANANTILYVGQKLKIPQSQLPLPAPAKPYVTYDSYTIQRGDTLWNLADKFGIPVSELTKANGITESSPLSIGQIIKIPVHQIPVKTTPGEKYGEYLDWFTEAQYVVPTQNVFEVVDFYTGKSFFAKRTTGSSHADVET